jgi:hypothetical protein
VVDGSSRLAAARQAADDNSPLLRLSDGLLAVSPSAGFPLGEQPLYPLAHFGRNTREAVPDSGA